VLGDSGSSHSDEARDTKRFHLAVPIFFPFNSARINNEHKACLDEIALKMQQDPDLVGNRPVIAIPSERVGISLTRANNARDYLVTRRASIRRG